MHEIEQAGTTYYNDPIESTVRFRLDPPTAVWKRKTGSSGWQYMYNSITGLSLTVTAETIEVHGMGPFGRGRIGKFFGFEPSLNPCETSMTTIRLSRIVIGRWGVPRPKVDFIALSRPTGDDSHYTLALRPSDHDLDRLREALRLAGVRES